MRGKGNAAFLKMGKVEYWGLWLIALILVSAVMFW